MSGTPGGHFVVDQHGDVNVSASKGLGDVREMHAGWRLA